MAWIVLVVAGLFETAWALALKESEARIVPIGLIAIGIVWLTLAAGT